MSRLREACLRARRALPRGQTLPDEAWAGRHRAMLWILWAHVIVLPLFALSRGHGVLESVGPVIPIALAGGVGMRRDISRRARSVAVVFGLLTASAVLVNAWNGQIEAHFHFFVMIAVLALYEDWLPFGLAVGYVTVEHGLLGAIAPHHVYNHSGDPWTWAAIHGLFVLGAVAASVVTWRLNEDMRARMVEAHRAARETAEGFKVAFESGVSGMAMVAPDGRFLRVNRALCQMTGYTEAELLERTFQGITHPDDVDTDVDQLRAIMAGEVAVYETEKRYLHREGREVWVQIGVKTIRDEQGRVEYLLSQTNDVTMRKRFEDELAHRALHDPLTGMPNRELFLDRLSHAVLRLARHPGQIAVLFMDLDRFKLVNDGMGHSVGDAVLVETAARLSEAVRTEDTVARFGGDEFTILCENVKEGEVSRVAQRVLAAFARPFEHEGREFHLNASVGVRVNDVASASADALLRDADVALYAAKAHGRGRFEIYDAGARMPGVDLLASEQELRLALRHGELCVHYQPEVRLATGRITAVEALVRWEHPERGLMLPEAFVPVAEESGLIVAAGDWVLREACTQLAAWREAGTVGKDFRVAVNISGRQLSHPELPETVVGALTSAGLEAGALCLEITESALIHDTAVALANLIALKRHGVVIALDDFGVGFSSLSHIRDLPPVDILKIDRSFIAGLGRNKSDDAVVTAVLSLAANLGLTAVAEGIEREQQLEALRRLGCDAGQGFYFAHPQPPQEMAAILAAGTAPARVTPTAEPTRA